MQVQVSFKPHPGSDSVKGTEADQFSNHHSACVTADSSLKAPALSFWFDIVRGPGRQDNEKKFQVVTDDKLLLIRRNSKGFEPTYGHVGFRER